ncbi:hypothetical protein E2562_003739, partial [Oryza meyeriana var. granulata]
MKADWSFFHHAGELCLSSEVSRMLQYPQPAGQSLVSVFYKGNAARSREGQGRVYPLGVAALDGGNAIWSPLGMKSGSPPLATEPTTLYGGNAVRSPRRTRRDLPPLAMKASALYGDNAVRSPRGTQWGLPPRHRGTRRRPCCPESAGDEVRFTPSGDEAHSALRRQRRLESVKDMVGSTPSGDEGFGTLRRQCCLEPLG